MKFKPGDEVIVVKRLDIDGSDDAVYSCKHFGFSGVVTKYNTAIGMEKCLWTKGMTFNMHEDCFILASELTDFEKLILNCLTAKETE